MISKILDIEGICQDSVLKNKVKKWLQITSSSFELRNTWFYKEKN